MEDIIDIIVTETTNTIEITSQPTDEIIDVNIIDNREDITLNVTPTLVEININSLTGNFGVNWGDITGTLADQTDLNTALGLKADLVDGKVPSSQLPSYVDDVIEVATYSALPATGEVGKIYVVLDTNLIYRWSGSAYIEIKDSSAVWGAITGTLSSQTDLQNALNAKFNNPTGDTTQYIAGDGSLITFPVAGQAGTLVREVRNTTGATLTKGTIVYISGATGNKPTVSKAIATGDSTSAQTFGMCQADISNNSNGYVVCVGDITGLDTSAVSEGVQLYLSSTTAGTYTTTKQLAPAHLVYIGVVTRSHPTQGQIEVKIQNGYELDEIHDVAISSVANNDGLFYESSSSLWKNKSIATVLGYTPVQGTGATGYYARFTGSSAISDGFIQTTSNITYVEGMGLSTLNGLDITGNYGAGGGGLKIRSYDETTGNAYIDFANTGGRFYLGVNRSTASGLMTNATAYATVLTTGLGTTNLEFGTNATKRLTLDGTTGAATFTSSVTTSGVYLTGMTSGSGALYYNSGANRVTVANYNTSGIVVFEVSGGATALTLNSNTSATFASSISGTSAGFSGNVIGLQLGVGGQTPRTSSSLKTIESTNYVLEDNGDFGLKSNAYYNGTNNVYINSAGASRIYLGGGSFTYYDAPSGTAGGTVTFTPRFTIANGGAATFLSSVTIAGTNDGYGTLYVNALSSTNAARLRNDNASFATLDVLNSNASGFGVYAVANKHHFGGNVGIGTTSPTNGKLEVQTSSTSAGLWVQTGGTSGSYTIADFRTGTNLSAFSIKGNGDIYASNGAAFFFGSSAATYLAGGDTSMSFAVNNSERMRITSGGQLLIGTTSANGKVNITQDQSTNNQYLNFVGTQSSYNQEWGFGIVNNTKHFRLYDYTAGVEQFRFTNGGTLGIAGGSDVNNAVLDKLSIGYYNTGGYGWLQTWNGTSLYLNKSGNAVYAGAVRLDILSDKRVKDNIQSINGALNTVMNITGKKFHLKDEEEGKIRYGFIAQELEGVLDDFVVQTNNTFKKDELEVKNVKTIENWGSSWAALLVEAIKEQQVQIQDLKKQLENN